MTEFVIDGDARLDEANMLAHSEVYVPPILMVYPVSSKLSLCLAMLEGLVLSLLCNEAQKANIANIANAAT